MKVSEMGVGFVSDEEKMRDFVKMTRGEFLSSYSYLTEEEYDATKEALEWADEMEIEENGLSVITWPESQSFMGMDRATLINDSIGYRLFGDCAYLVPDEML